MDPSGWFVMIISVGGVSAFFAWTLYMVMTRKPSETEHMHSVLSDTPPDIDLDEETRG